MQSRKLVCLKAASLGSSYFLHLLRPCPQTIHKRVRIRTAHGGEDWPSDPGSHPTLWPTGRRPLCKSLCAAGFCQLSTGISSPLLPKVSQVTSASIWKIPKMPIIPVLLSPIHCRGYESVNVYEGLWLPHESTENLLLSNALKWHLLVSFKCRDSSKHINKWKWYRKVKEENNTWGSTVWLFNIKLKPVGDIF